MNKVIDRLEFMVKMNERLKKETFDDLFEDDEFIIKFGQFINSPQASKWLTKPEGMRYIMWQR